MIQLYVTDITLLEDPLECKELMEQLPEERQEKIRKSKQLRSRKQSFGAGLLLQQVLEEAGLADKEITINSHGKPEVDGIYFNISHSGNKVICAVADVPVGCDIEWLREEPEGVAERFFAESEKAYVKCKEDFFRLWTRKESYLKMTGEGIRVPMHEFEIIPGDPVRVKRNGVFVDCSFSECEIEDYYISVCYAGGF